MHYNISHSVYFGLLLAVPHSTRMTRKVTRNLVVYAHNSQARLEICPMLRIAQVVS